jgi:hypothetical protein
MSRKDLLDHLLLSVLRTRLLKAIQSQQIVGSQPLEYVLRVAGQHKQLCELHLKLLLEQGPVLLGVG